MDSFPCVNDDGVAVAIGKTIESSVFLSLPANKSSIGGPINELYAGFYIEFYFKVWKSIDLPTTLGLVLNPSFSKASFSFGFFVLISFFLNRALVTIDFGIKSYVVLFK